MKNARFAFPPKAVFLFFAALCVLYLCYALTANDSTVPIPRPQDYPQIFSLGQLGPFRHSTPAGPEDGQCRIVRQPKALYTLRFLYWTTDGGATFQGYAIGTEIRWDRVGGAFVFGTLLLCCLPMIRLVKPVQ